MGRFGRRRVGAPGGGARLTGYGAETPGLREAGRGWAAIEQAADQIADVFARQNVLRQRQEREEQLAAAKAEQEQRDAAAELEAQRQNIALAEHQAAREQPGFVPPEGEIVQAPPGPAPPVEFQAQVAGQLAEAELEGAEERLERDLKYQETQRKERGKLEAGKNKAYTQIEKYRKAEEAAEDRGLRYQELYAAQQQRQLTAEERSEFYAMRDDRARQDKVDAARDKWEDDAALYVRAQREVDRELKERKARGLPSPQGGKAMREEMYRGRMDQLRWESGWYNERMEFDPEASPARQRLEEELARAPRNPLTDRITPEEVAEAQQVRFRLPREMRDWKAGTWRAYGLSADWAAHMARIGDVQRQTDAASGRTAPVDPGVATMGMSGSSAAPAPPDPILEQVSPPTSSPLRQEEVEDALGDLAEDQVAASAEADAEAILAPGGTIGEPGLGVPPPTPPEATPPSAGPAPAPTTLEAGAVQEPETQSWINWVYGGLEAEDLPPAQEQAAKSDLKQRVEEGLLEKASQALLSGEGAVDPRLSQAQAFHAEKQRKEAKRRAGEIQSLQDQLEELDARTEAEGWTAEAKLQRARTLHKGLNTKLYGAELAGHIDTASRYVEKEIAAGRMDPEQAQQWSQEFLGRVVNKLQQEARGRILEGKAQEWDAAYVQLHETLTDPKEFGKFMLTTGVPMAVAMGTGIGGVGLLGRLALTAFAAGGMELAMNGGVLDERGNVDWNAIRSAGITGVTSVGEVPGGDFVRRIASKAGQGVWGRAMQYGAGALVEGLEEPFQENLASLLSEGKLSTPGETLVAAALGGMMGPGFGLMAGVDAAKRTAPELFNEELLETLTPEQLQAQIQEVLPAIEAELAGEVTPQALEEAPAIPEAELAEELEAVTPAVPEAPTTAEAELERMARAAEEVAAEEPPAPTAEEEAAAEEVRAVEERKKSARAAVEAMHQVMPKQTWEQDAEDPTRYTTEVETPAGKRTLEMRLGEDFIEVSAAALAKHGLTPEQARREGKGAAGLFRPAKIRLNENDIIRVLKNEGAETVGHEVFHFYRSAGIVSQTDWATFRMKYEPTARAAIGAEKYDALSDVKKEQAVEEHVANAFGEYARKRTQGAKLKKAPAIFRKVYESLRQFGVALRGGDTAAFDRLLRQDVKGEAKAAKLGSKAAAAIRRIRAGQPRAAGRAIAVTTDGEAAAIIPLRKPEGNFETDKAIRSDAFAFETLHGEFSNAKRVDADPAMRTRALKQMRSQPSDQERLGIKAKPGDQPTWTRAEMVGGQLVITQYAENAADPDDPMIVGLLELNEDGSIGGIAGGRQVSGGITNADPLYALGRQLGASHSGVFMPKGREAMERRMEQGKGVYPEGDYSAWYDNLLRVAPEFSEAINYFRSHIGRGPATAVERNKVGVYRKQLTEAMERLGDTALEQQAWPSVPAEAAMAEDLGFTDADIDQLLGAIEADDAANIKVLEKLEKGWKPPLDVDVEIGPYGPAQVTGKPLRRRLTRGEQIAKLLDEETVAQLGALTGYSNDKLKKDPELRARVLDRVVRQAEEEMKYALQEDDTGREWYSNNVKAMEDILAEARPESFKGKKAATNRAAFKLLLAITSTGQRVRPNAQIALEIWDHYVKHKVFPVARQSGLEWGRLTIGNQLELLNSLVEKRGLAKTIKLMRQPMTYDQIVETFGRKPSGITKGGAPGFQYFGSHVLGPKLGAFFQNLDGNFQPLTADLWWSRSFNRWLGLMWDRNEAGEIQWKVAKKKEGGRVVSEKTIPSVHQDPRGFNERAFMQEVARHLGEKFGMDTASAQAVLWYYEQRLWDKLGGAVDVEVSYDKAIGELVATERAAGEAAAQLREDATAVRSPRRRKRSRQEDADLDEAASIRHTKEVSRPGDLWRRITKRALTRLEEIRSPDGRGVGRYVAEQLREKTEYQERKTSALSSQFRRALTAYKKTRGDKWQEGWEQVRLALDNRQVSPASLGGPEKALYTVSRAILNTARKDAIEAQTFSGQMIQHYFPHMSVAEGTFDYDELIDQYAAELERPENATKLKALRERDAEWLAGLIGDASTRDLAAIDLGRNFNRETFWRANPNLERHRTGAMGEYATSPEVIEAYLLKAYDRIGSGRYFGPKAQVLMEGMRGLRKRDQQFARDVVRDALGKTREPGYLGESPAVLAREVGALNGLAKLGMAALPQITQTAAATSEAIGASGLARSVRDVVNTAGALFTNARGLITDAERSGATYAATANEAMQAYAGTGNRTFVERMFTGLFNLGGLIPAVTKGKWRPGERLVGSTYFVRDLDKMARVYANRLGQLTYLRALEAGNNDVLLDLLGTQERVNQALENDRPRAHQLRELLESGRAGDVTFEREMARPPEGEPIYAGRTAGLAPGVERLDMAGKRFADKTQYRTRAAEMPVGFSHPVMKAMNTFYSFHYQHWRWNVEHWKALREARAKGNEQASRRHARTLIAHHLAVAPMIGYGSLLLRSFLTGRGAGEEELEQRDLTQLGTYAEALDKVMGLGPMDPRVDPALAYLQAWQFSGGLGYPLALVERTTRAMQKGRADPGRGMASMIGGAPGETLYDTGKLAMMANQVAVKWADGTLRKSDWERFKRQTVRQTSHLLPNPFGLSGGLRRELTKTERWPVESPGWWGLVFDPDAYWSPQYGVTSPAYQEARRARREAKQEELESRRESAAESWEE